MTEKTVPITGGCLCGAVRWGVEGPVTMAQRRPGRSLTRPSARAPWGGCVGMANRPSRAR